MTHRQVGATDAVSTMPMIEQHRPATCPPFAGQFLFRSPGPPPEPFVHRHCTLAKPKGVTCTAACRRVERGIPNGCWSTAHLPIAISELPADRSVNYFVDEVDDSSSGRSSRMRCLVQ